MTSTRRAFPIENRNGDDLLRISAQRIGGGFPERYCVATPARVLRCARSLVWRDNRRALLAFSAVAVLCLKTQTPSEAFALASGVARISRQRALADAALPPVRIRKDQRPLSSALSLALPILAASTRTAASVLPAASKRQPLSCDRRSDSNR